MLLAFDIGNSDITIGLHAGTEWKPVWRVPSLPDLQETFYAMKVREHFLENRLGVGDVSHVVISSVVPDLTGKIVQVAHMLFEKEPVVLGPDVYSRLPIKILRPYEIGADLVSNALAGFTLFKRSCVVVDFGTALTFTTLANDGEILGVSIAPGLKTAIKSLSQNTAKLFDVPLTMPTSVLGRGTVHAIQAGVLVGYEGMVKHMLQRIKAELKDDGLKSVATGGLSSIIPSLKETFDVMDPFLTLNGLKLISEMYR
ncbi:type III pantothenate kinase [Chryseolinea lacunae]|uniref:Type III pantothenate kinase n=1 Tax=Chryseolinea lacunae TaxID=2801331 RepID=A0ABS1KXI8_9BACT|nr:type III pantothenate kinase [Chryseolinea lacunae]MBL0744050.1 type III pantothenate kinase [Chryseolinea lacunae]